MIIEPRTSPGKFAITLPLRTVSEANVHSHWWWKHKRTKSVRKTVWYLLGSWKQLLPPLPATILVRRHGPRLLDAQDNLPRALKAVVDGIADVYEVDDADGRYAWRYDQVRDKEYAVDIEISVREFYHDATVQPAAT